MIFFVPEATKDRKIVSPAVSLKILGSGFNQEF
jgi:hypothetical protein